MCADISTHGDRLMMDDIDENVSGGYSGTFRWKKTKALPGLPATSSVLADDTEHLQESMKGWMQYLVSRCETVEECNKLIALAKHDMSLIDCLSSPVSVGFALSELGVFPHHGAEQLHIVCMGCSAKCEERILRETNCWSEINRFIGATSSCKVWITGPEMSVTDEHFQSMHQNCHTNIQFGLFQGTSVEFFRAHPSLLSGAVIAVGLNCGFGNWENPLPARYNLLFNWLPDLYFLTGTKIPLVFTCANDYADVAGESGVMHRILGANFLTAPRENPFGFASTLIPPGVKPEDASRVYTRGNSFLYCVQGHDRGRRCIVNTKSPGSRVAEFVRSYNRTLSCGAICVVPLQWSHSTEAEAIITSKITTSNSLGQEKPQTKVKTPSATEPVGPPRDGGHVESPKLSVDTIDGVLKVTQSISVSQRSELDRIKHLKVEVEILPGIHDIGPKDIELSYSQEAALFHVCLARVQLSSTFPALVPITQSSIVAKARKKIKSLIISADILQ